MLPDLFFLTFFIVVIKQIVWLLSELILLNESAFCHKLGKNAKHHKSQPFDHGMLQPVIAQHPKCDHMSMGDVTFHNAI